MQMFRVSNTLTNGSAWDNTNMTPATRPIFEDGTALNQAALNNHKSVELTNAGNSFQNNQTYSWGASGLVSATNQSFSFCLASSDLSYVNSASNNGQPSRIGTPHFGTNAQLQLTLSGQGISTPTMTTPVTIDSWNHRIYAVNTNTLYALTYASATGDATATPYASAYFAERSANFSDAAQSYFALTGLGKSQGPVSGSTYVANDCAPLFTGSNIYVVDNFGGTQASVNRFTPGLPPALQADTVTLSSVANGKRSATYLVFDNIGSKLFAGSYDPAGQGQCWVLTQ
jgi:hypothetical protein